MAGLQGGFLATRISPAVTGNRRIAAIRSTVAKLAVEQGRVSSKFAQLRDSGKVALIPYITAGDPSLALTAQAIKLLDSRGADIIELGVPYSDPLADGPVIQAAASRALECGTTLDSVLSMVHELAPTTRAPLVLFIYFNPILKRGIENFCKQVKAAGVAGLVVPDVPLEETGLLRKHTEANGIELVLLTTPTTPKQRMKEISESSQGFIYLVSLTGVTGARSSVDARVQDLLKDIKEVTDKPVAVGFGVSGAEQAAQIAKWGADGVIVGSAVVKILAESQNGDLSQLDAFMSELKSVL